MKGPHLRLFRDHGRMTQRHGVGHGWRTAACRRDVGRDTPGGFTRRTDECLHKHGGEINRAALVARPTNGLTR